MLLSSIIPTTWLTPFGECQNFPPAQLRSSFDNTARSSILSFLQGAIKVGYLEITDSHGVHRFGTYQEGKNAVRVTVNNDLFYVRVLSSADLGLGESYMVNDIDIDNIKGMIDVGFHFRTSIWALATPSVALARQSRQDDRS